MKYFVEQITVMKDGTTANSITEAATERDAISQFHMIMASGVINDNISTLYACAKNNVGGRYEEKTYVNNTPVVETPQEVADAF